MRMPLFNRGSVMGEDVLNAIIFAESSGNKLALSSKGARGLMQITQPALDDYNTFHTEKMSMDDMYEGTKNRTVGNWYFNKRIPQMLKHFKIEDTTENRLWSYNAGIGNVVKGIKPQETVDYIGKVMSRIGE